MSESEPQFQDLERKIDDLIALCADQQRKISTLLAAASQTTAERLQLLDKNELARIRVEAMISRLKAMEQDQ